ncbi:GNAT family N-acetyltransferase [Paenibacillus sp. IHB B 3415]|uniref:GNAT family N-acetyltransferase n=1 Tax=Paenibacillus sp. IHB B 3415 TaxID=867080 RepID=UPI000AA1B53E|nr:GNAT family N-acetyltransferase [Paenibacillus sp. IHB B 3415]
MGFTYHTDIPDMDEYYSLYQSTGWNADRLWTKEHMHMALKNSWHILTVYEDDRLVATGRIVSDGVIQCYVCDMIVLPAYQKQGLGRAVMDQLISHCRSRGIRWIQLSSAQGKSGFYSQFGFLERPAGAPGMSLFL